MINNIILEFNNKIKFFLLNKFFFNFNRITKKIKKKLTIKTKTIKSAPKKINERYK